MAYIIDSKANISFKRFLGKAHTSNERDPANEPISSGFQISAQNVYSQKLHPTDPNDPINSSRVAQGDGVNSRIKFNLTPISGTNGAGRFTSYYVTIPNPVPASLSTIVNPLTGAVYAAGDRITNLISDSFGFNYIAKPFSNNVEVPPSDASDWFLDYYSGILTQEQDIPGSMIDYTLSNSRLEAYAYVGEMVTDTLSRLDAHGMAYQFFDYQTIGSGITGQLDGVNKVFMLAQEPDAGSVYVHVNGMLQLPGGNDYSISGNTVTFENAPSIGDVIIINYRITSEY